MAETRNLHSLVFDGESHITKIEALMQAASALADSIADAKDAALVALHGKTTTGTADGLCAVLDTVNLHIAELRAWWTQLHELDDARAREARHV
jgi:hypothetical protein